MKQAKYRSLTMKTKLEIINMVNNLPPGSTELSNCYNVYVYRLCGMADNSNFLLFQIFGLDAWTTCTVYMLHYNILEHYLHIVH